MTFTIGRFGLDLIAPDVVGVSSVEDAGESVVVNGYVAVSDLAEVEVRRQQLLGYVDRPDEEFVPVTWSENAALDGFYRVLSGSVDTAPGLEFSGYATFSVTLERVQAFAGPVVELVVSGGSRSAESQVITNEFKNPFFDGAGAPVANGSLSSVGIVGGRARGVTAGSAAAGIQLSGGSDRPVASAGQYWWAYFTGYNGAGSERAMQATIRAFDGGGSFVGVVAASPGTTVPGGGSQVFAISGVAPAGTASVVIVFERVAGSGAAAGDVVEADGVYLGRSDPALLDVSPTVFSGATAGCAWTGATNASASTRTLTWGSGAVGRISIPGDAVSLVTIDRDNTVASPTLLSANLESGTVRRFSTPADSFVAQFTLPAASFYDGAATLEAGDPLAVVTGRQIGNTPEDWLLSNGRFELRPVAGTTMTFEMREYISAAWTDWQTVTVDATRDPAFNGKLHNPHTLTVLRNSPECVIIRLSAKQTYTEGTNSHESPVTVDISLRRGARMVAVEVKMAIESYPSVAVEGFSAAARFNHGWYLASVSSFVRSPQDIQAVSGSPALIRTPAYKTAFSFGVGFGKQPTTIQVPPNEYESTYYLWAGSERQRTVTQ